MMFDIVPIWVKFVIAIISVVALSFVFDYKFVKPWRDKAEIWRDKAELYGKMNKQKDKQIEDIGNELNRYLQNIIEVINEENSTTPSTLHNLTTG